MANILIVEDESLIAMELEKLVRSHGHHVAGKTASGEGAVDLAVSMSPDLVLMDIHLAGRMDGVEAARLIQSEMDIPVVFVTAFGDSVLHKALEVAPYGYVMKPFSSDQVKATVATALERKTADAHRQDQLASSMRESRHEAEDMATALRTVMKTVEEDKRAVRSEMTQRLKSEIIPNLDRMAVEPSRDARRGFREAIIQGLAGLADEEGRGMEHSLLALTPTELQICRYIRSGRSTKEIAVMTNSAYDTVQTHRKNIRRKLGLKGKQTSLYSHLLAMESQAGM